MSEWRPIGTAPNETVVVGGYFGREGNVVWWEEVANPFLKVEIEGGIFRKYKYEVKNVYINSSFTHWRPLPDPPEINQ